MRESVTDKKTEVERQTERGGGRERDAAERERERQTEGPNSLKPYRLHEVLKGLVPPQTL